MPALAGRKFVKPPKGGTPTGSFFKVPTSRSARPSSVGTLVFPRVNGYSFAMKMKEADIRQRPAEDARLSAFQRRVYEALLEVPRGYVTTYGLLARRIGCRSAQAVGGALRANPYAPEVPCHRVVSSDLSIGGFCGHVCGEPVCRKIALLKKEGVPLDAAGRVLDAGRVWRFSKGRTC